MINIDIKNLDIERALNECLINTIDDGELVEEIKYQELP